MLKDRIRALRKALGLNQSDFGNKIGVKQGTVAGYETGVRNPLDTVISSICREFGVNEAWLRTGEGDMFIERSPEEETGYFVEDLLEYSGEGNPFYDMIIEMMIDYRKLDDVSKLAVQKYFKAVSDGLKKKGEA